MEWIRTNRSPILFALLFAIIASTLLWLWESGRLVAKADAPNAAQQAAIEALQQIQEENDELVGQLSALQAQLAALGGTQPADMASEGSESPTSSMSSQPAPTATASQSSKINLSSASQAQLETLPGIGPAKAQAILEYRTSHGFKSTKDLLGVKGIGEKTYAKLAPLVTVE